MNPLCIFFFAWQLGTRAVYKADLKEFFSVVSRIGFQQAVKNF